MFVKWLWVILKNLVTFGDKKLKKDKKEEKQNKKL